MKIDIIGDIHGCFHEFREITTRLEYKWVNGIPVHDNRMLGVVGDITDRGPQSVDMIEVVWKLWKKGAAHYVPGNHCNKLYRYFLGRKVQISHGLETTVAELKKLSLKKENHVRKMFVELYEQSPIYHILDDGNLIIAHAGIKEADIGTYNKSVKTFVLYGDITGEVNSNGTPVRRDWAKQYQGDPFIVYGHTPVLEPRKINNTINIDTGAVFGGSLTAFRYPEMKTISVASTMPYIKEKFRQFE